MTSIKHSITDNSPYGKSIFLSLPRNRVARSLLESQALNWTKLLTKSSTTNIQPSQENACHCCGYDFNSWTWTRIQRKMQIKETIYVYWKAFGQWDWIRSSESDTATGLKSQPVSKHSKVKLELSKYVWLQFWFQTQTCSVFTSIISILTTF